MAKQWSDYRNTVYGYLKHYKQFLGQIANLDIQIEGIEGQLQTLYDVKPVKYGESLPGGFNELSPMEQLFARKQALETKLPSLKADRQCLQNLIQRIDNAMLTLGEIEAKIIRLRFIEGKRWPMISAETLYSERRCQELSGKAINSVTGIMFPESVDGQQQFNFVFLPSPPA